MLDFGVFSTLPSPHQSPTSSPLPYLSETTQAVIASAKASAPAGHQRASGVEPSELLCLFERFDRAFLACKDPSKPRKLCVGLAAVRAKYLELHGSEISLSKAKRLLAGFPRLLPSREGFDGPRLLLDNTIFHRGFEEKLRMRRLGEARVLARERAVFVPEAEGSEPGGVERSAALKSRILATVRLREQQMSSSSLSVDLLGNSRLLLEVAERLKALFIAKKVSNFYAALAAKHLCEKSSLSVCLDLQECFAAMKRLAVKAPMWFKLVEHRTGMILQVDTQVSLATLADVINI